MSQYIYIVGRDSVPVRWTLQEDDRVEMTLVILPGVSCELPLCVELVGPHAELLIRGLYLCGADEMVHIDVDVRHLSGQTTSRQLFKGIVGGRAQVAFHGLIYVAQDAQKIKAYQEDHNILLSDSARVDTRPQLEIYADDVECSHGATVGQLSEDELFYMRSRGIPESQARALQMISFITPVIEGLPEDTKQKVLDALSDL